MPRIIEERELVARLRLRRLQIAALLAAGALLGAGMQTLPPLDDAFAESAQAPPAPTHGAPLQLRMSTRLRTPTSVARAD